MPYTSEELNGNFYQDNNNYTEIGELHASSKQAVVGRVDSRYKNTKKISNKGIFLLKFTSIHDF